MERNTASLEYHIKRTDLLEASTKEIKSELDPISDHVKLMKFFGKIFLWLFGSSLGLALLKYLIKF